MAKRKSKPKTGVKSLKMPAVTAYLFAGLGVVFIVIFLGYLFAKGNEGKAAEEKKSTQENAVWAKQVSEWKSSGTLISVTKDQREDGVAVINRDKWDKLRFDSKEALAIAIARADNIKTLELKDESGYNLGICRYGMRLRENKQ